MYRNDILLRSSRRVTIYYGNNKKSTTTNWSLVMNNLISVHFYFAFCACRAVMYIVCDSNKSSKLYSWRYMWGHLCLIIASIFNPFHLFRNAHGVLSFDQSLRYCRNKLPVRTRIARMYDPSHWSIWLIDWSWNAFMDSSHLMWMIPV